MPLTLTEHEIRTIHEAISCEALGPIETDKVRYENGTIVVACSDGDQFHDLFNTHCTQCNTKRNHIFALNGGALLIGRQSPIPFADIDGEVYLRHMAAGSDMKKIRTISLYTHAPCGAAHAAGLNFLDVMFWLLKAKQRVREQFRDTHATQIICHVHLDINGEKGTRHVHREKMITFLNKKGKHVTP